MDSFHSNTSACKGKHLSYEERVIIQTRCKDGFSMRQIARELHRSPTTISNEIKRGLVSLWHGKVQRYKAKQGQQTYKERRKNCGRKYRISLVPAFMQYVKQHFHEEGWSLDACRGRALRVDQMSLDDVVCTKTLYNYVSCGLLGIKAIELPMKVRRKTKKTRDRVHKRKLGRSIEERHPKIDTREEFGHWEMDLVLGAKTKDDKALLVMIERKTRAYLTMPIASKTPEAVGKALESIRRSLGDKFDQIVKTITTDNGSEFASLSDIEKTTGTLVYYAHPYSPYEKGTIENTNGLLRRLLPKGRRIDSVDIDELITMMNWCNELPRKSLNYKTSRECIQQELEQLWAA